MLNKKQKENLSDMYRNKDLYEPEKDRMQEPANFAEHNFNEGGYCMAHGGYCMSEGGEVKGHKKVEKVMHEFGSGKLKSSSGDKVKNRDQAIAIALSEAGMSKNKAEGGMVGYDDGGEVDTSNIASTPSPAPQPKLNSDQFNDLVTALNQKGVGQSVASGAATLGDALMQGVSRAGPSNFEKNIEEMRQNKNQNLINALRAKYETQFKGQELGQGQQRLGIEAQRAAQEAKQNAAANALREKEIEETEKQRQTQAGTLKFQQEKAGSEQALQQQKAVEEAAAKSAELGQQSRSWLSKLAGWNSPEATAAQKVLQGQIKPNASATPQPGSVVQHANGNYKFLGGNPADPKSWQKI